MGIGLHNLGLRGGGFKKSRGPRQLHNYVPKQKRAGENPLQVNKPHRMRKKEKDRTKAETKMKNVLASVKMEDREKLYDAGAIDAPFHSDKFRSRAARVKTGDISDLSEFDDEAVVKEVVDVKRKRKDRDSKEWRGRRVGRAGPTEDEQMGAAAGTENTGLGGDPADSHAGYSGGVAAMEDEEELKLPEQKKVSSMEKLSEGLAKGDVVEYRDAQGAWVRAEVMSVDRGIAPISVSVQLSGGHVRETVLERLRAIARPPPPASSCLASFRGPRGFDAGVAPPREQVTLPPVRLPSPSPPSTHHAPPSAPQPRGRSPPHTRGDIPLTLAQPHHGHYGSCPSHHGQEYTVATLVSIRTKHTVPRWAGIGSSERGSNRTVLRPRARGHPQPRPPRRHAPPAPLLL